VIEYILKYLKLKIPGIEHAEHHVSSYGSFYNELSDIESKGYHRDFYDYMLALYGLLLQYRGSEPSTGLLADILIQAYSAPAYPFDPDWLDSASQPSFEELMESKSSDEGFEVLYKAMRFQISELYRMKDNWPSQQEQLYGFTSPSGNRWENLHPIYNLKSGIRCMKDYKMDTDRISWHYLAIAFEFGRVYE